LQRWLVGRSDNVDFNPETTPTDCCTIANLPFKPLGEKSEVVAIFASAWPAIEWEDLGLDGETVCGRLKIGGLSLCLTMSFKPGHHGASIESDPYGAYFDNELIDQILAVCEANGWTVIFHDSAEDEFI
jgi:hypothetical protein